MSGLIAARHPTREKLHLLRPPWRLPAAWRRHLADGDTFVDVVGIGVVVLGITHVRIIGEMDPEGFHMLDVLLREQRQDVGLKAHDVVHEHLRSGYWEDSHDD